MEVRLYESINQMNFSQEERRLNFRSGWMPSPGGQVPVVSIYGNPNEGFTHPSSPYSPGAGWQNIGSFSGNYGQNLSISSLPGQKLSTVSARTSQRDFGKEVSPRSGPTSFLDLSNPLQKRVPLIFGGTPPVSQPDLKRLGGNGEGSPQKLKVFEPPKSVSVTRALPSRESFSRGLPSMGTPREGNQRVGILGWGTQTGEIQSGGTQGGENLNKSTQGGGTPSGGGGSSPKPERKERIGFIQLLSRGYAQWGSRLTGKDDFLCTCDFIRIHASRCSTIEGILNDLKAPEEEKMKSLYERALSSVLSTPELTKQISKDVDRTFSSFAFFGARGDGEGKARLTRLLLATCSFENIGYVQGINFIAASLLSHCEEHLAHFLMISLFERLNAASVYSRSLKGVTAHSQHFFNQICMRNLPETYRALQLKGITAEMLFPNWFLTWGFDTVPLGYHMKIIRGLLSSGWEFIYSILLQLVRELSEVVRFLDMGETLMVLKKPDELNFKNSFKYNFDWKVFFSKI